MAAKKKKPPKAEEPKANIKVVPFVPAHMAFCDFHDVFADQAKGEDPELLAECSHEAWTWIDESNGEVIAIVGAVRSHPRVFYMWSFMSKRAARHMLRIHRFSSHWITTLGAVRLEGTVVKNFKPGHRWMRMLGFRKETERPMKRWDGVHDCHLYSKVFI